MITYRMRCDKCSHEFDIQGDAKFCPECGHNWATCLTGKRTKGRKFKATPPPDNEPLNISEEDKEALRQMNQAMSKRLL